MHLLGDILMNDMKGIYIPYNLIMLNLGSRLGDNAQKLKILTRTTINIDVI